MGIYIEYVIYLFTYLLIIYLLTLSFETSFYVALAC